MKEGQSVYDVKDLFLFFTQLTLILLDWILKNVVTLILPSSIARDS